MSKSEIIDIQIENEQLKYKNSLLQEEIAKLEALSRRLELEKINLITIKSEYEYLKQAAFQTSGY